MNIVITQWSTKEEQSFAAILRWEIFFKFWNEDAKFAIGLVCSSNTARENKQNIFTKLFKIHFMSKCPMNITLKVFPVVDKWIMKICLNLFFCTVEIVISEQWSWKVAWFLKEHYCPARNHTTLHDHVLLVTCSTLHCMQNYGYKIPRHLCNVA